MTPDLWPLGLLLVPGTARPASEDLISDLFKSLVQVSYRLLGGVGALVRANRADLEDPIGVHQMRKLAATYAIQVGQEEQVVKVKLGFFDRANFEKELRRRSATVTRSLCPSRRFIRSQQGT